MSLKPYTETPESGASPIRRRAHPVGLAPGRGEGAAEGEIPLLTTYWSAST